MKDWSLSSSPFERNVTLGNEIHYRFLFTVSALYLYTHLGKVTCTTRPEMYLDQEWGNCRIPSWNSRDLHPPCFTVEGSSTTLWVLFLTGDTLILSVSTPQDMKSLFPKPLTPTPTCYSFALLTSFCNQNRLKIFKSHKICSYCGLLSFDVFYNKYKVI